MVGWVIRHETLVYCGCVIQLTSDFRILWLCKSLETWRFSLRQLKYTATGPTSLRFFHIILSARDDNYLSKLPNYLSLGITRPIFEPPIYRFRDGQSNHLSKWTATRLDELLNESVAHNHSDPSFPSFPTSSDVRGVEHRAVASFHDWSRNWRPIRVLVKPQKDLLQLDKYPPGDKFYTVSQRRLGDLTRHPYWFDLCIEVDFVKLTWTVSGLGWRMGAMYGILCWIF